jgi:hypothetical protein
MNPCLTCRFADWKRTAAGRLHPDGTGRCTWRIPSLALPKAHYYVGGGSEKRTIPQPSGGWIERKDAAECPAFEEASP